MGELLLYIGIFLLIFRFSKRSTRFVMLGTYGLAALGAGIFLLANVGSFFDFGAVRGASDLGDILELIGIFIAVAAIGGAVLRGAVRGFISQKRFEWRVDRFFDAWHSRNDRWL